MRSVSSDHHFAACSPAVKSGRRSSAPLGTARASRDAPGVVSLAPANLRSGHKEESSAFGSSFLNGTGVASGPEVGAFAKLVDHECYLSGFGKISGGALGITD